MIIHRRGRYDGRAVNHFYRVDFVTGVECGAPVQRQSEEYLGWEIACPYDRALGAMAKCERRGRTDSLGYRMARQMVLRYWSNRIEKVRYIVDPNATYQQIANVLLRGVNSRNRTYVLDKCWDLKEWIVRGGFPPSGWVRREILEWLDSKIATL